MALESIRLNHPSTIVQFYDDSLTCLPIMPDEILLRIFEWLSFQDLSARLIQVSRRFRRLNEDVLRRVVKDYFAVARTFPSYFALHSMTILDIRKHTQRLSEGQSLKGVMSPEIDQTLDVCVFGLEGWCEFITTNAESHKIIVRVRKTGQQAIIDLRTMTSARFDTSKYKVAYFQKDLLIFSLTEEEPPISYWFERSSSELFALRWSAQHEQWTRAFHISNCLSYRFGDNRLVYSVDTDPNREKNEHLGHSLPERQSFFENVKWELGAEADESVREEMLRLAARTIFYADADPQEIIPERQALIDRFRQYFLAKSHEAEVGDGDGKFEDVLRHADSIVYSWNLTTGHTTNVSQMLGMEKCVLGFTHKSVLYLDNDFDPGLDGYFDFHVQGHTLHLSEDIQSSETSTWTQNLFSILFPDLILRAPNPIFVKPHPEIPYFLIDMAVDVPFLWDAIFDELHIKDQYVVFQEMRKDFVLPLMNTVDRLSFKIFDSETQTQLFPCEGNADSITLCHHYSPRYLFEYPYQWFILQTDMSTLVLWDLQEQKRIETIDCKFTISCIHYHDHTLSVLVTISKNVFKTLTYTFDDFGISHPTPSLIPQSLISKRSKTKHHDID